MEGKEAIVGRILSDAEEKGAKLRSEAQLRVKAEIAEAEKRAKELTDRGEAELARQAEEIVERRETVAALDCRKLLLGAKREMLSEVFALALEKAKAFDKKKYLAVVEDLLQKNAEEGDEVVLSRFAPIAETDLCRLLVFSERKLKFAGANGDFAGGVRLYSAVCDKDLSFEAVLASARGTLETEIAEKLFSEEN